MMYIFLAIVIQMGHDIRDTLKDYWSTLNNSIHYFTTQ